MLQGLNRRFGNGLRLQAGPAGRQVGDGFTIQGANKGVKDAGNKIPVPG